MKKSLIFLSEVRRMWLPISLVTIRYVKKIQSKLFSLKVSVIIIIRKAIASPKKLVGQDFLVFPEDHAEVPMC